jgi:hypothetical protein
MVKRKQPINSPERSAEGKKLVKRYMLEYHQDMLSGDTPRAEQSLALAKVTALVYGVEMEGGSNEHLSQNPEHLEAKQG